MASRRAVLLSALGLGAAGAAAYLFRANHVIPPRDSAAEERFRVLEQRVLASYGLSALSRQVPIAEPALDVHVLEAGRGEPVLFLHGGNSVAAGWIPLLAKLAGDSRVLAPDRPGCGLTTKFDYSGVELREHAVQFVRSAMDALGLDRASIVANSMGGYFALAFALAQPARIAKLILVGEPAGSAPEIRLANRPRGNANRELGLVRHGARAGTGDHAQQPPERLGRSSRRVPEVLVDCLTAGSAIPGAKESWITMNESIFRPRGLGLFSPASTLTYALRPELTGLRPPTLLLWGDRDTFGPPALGMEMAQLMPNGQCELLAEAGHLACLDALDQCAARVRSFLAS